MIRPVPESVDTSPRPWSPVVRRLGALAPLDELAFTALEQAVGRSRFIGARRDLLKEGAPVTEPLLLLSGWAARVRHLADGRRQVMSLLLPGDLIGFCRHPRPLMVSTIWSLTDVAVVAAPASDRSPSLADAYAVSQALDEAYLLEQIARLGRMSAEERLVDLFLELRERLELCGLASPSGFSLPLTQEMLADATGLTPVHVNRMLQHLRQRGDIVLKSGHLVLNDPEGLACRVGRSPVRVSD